MNRQRREGKSLKKFYKKKNPPNMGTISKCTDTLQKYYR